MRQSLEMFTRCLWVCALTGAGKGSKPLMATLPVPPHTVGIYPGRLMASGRGLGQSVLNAGHAWMEICSAVTSLC